MVQACRVAISPDDSVSDPRRTLAQAERRLRYVMERHGITRAGLKVVPHGLRHQDAADAYRSMTGEPPPVAGGGAVERSAGRTGAPGHRRTPGPRPPGDRQRVLRPTPPRRQGVFTRSPPEPRHPQPRTPRR